MSTLSFIHGLGFSDLPEAVVAQARRCLLDLIGVAASGRQTPCSRITHAFAARQMGAGEGAGARLLFDGRRAGAAGVAYAGASTIDSFDAHDGHALTKGHAGVAILPALFGIADFEGAARFGALDLRELLTGLVIGYEIATRAGIALHASAADYHTSGAWNALACAAVGARLLGLDGETTRHALGTAEFHGPRSQMMRCIDHPTMVKDGSGWGAFAGVSAAYLAADGFTGAPAITVEAADQAALWDDLGSRWRILEQYFKPLPVCRWAQPPIEAARALVAAHGLTPDRIAHVEVETFHNAVRLGTAVPVDTEAAQYALGFPLAAFLTRGRLGAAEIGPAGIADPGIRAMLARIVATERADLEAAFPALRFAVVTITDHAGNRYVSEPTRPRGDPDAPLSDAEILAKYEDLTETLAPERARAVRDLVLSGSDEPGGFLKLVDLVAAPIAP